MTSCQKCFRTVDLDIVGTTARHLTFFEMLGNFSIGDYFKQGAVEFAWELAREGFGFPAEAIWITVFEGDDALGLGPDEEAIEAWLAVGVPRERIVALRARRELLAERADRAVRAVTPSSTSTAGVQFGSPDDLPGGENARFLEFWNLVFMQYDQQPPEHADAAAGAQHRHRSGPEPHGDDPPGRADRLRHRPVPPADRAGGGAVGPPLRQR